MTASAMLELKRNRFEDVFVHTIDDARLRRQREDERAREIERLERNERDAKPVIPIAQDLNRKVLPWAIPLQRHARFKGASGGRGRGASHFFAEESVEEMVRNPSLRFACIREVQKALKFSAKSLVEQKIRTMNVSHLFEVLEREIRRVDGDGVMIFEGMQDHTADSIKSLENFGRAWVEEAHAISQRSLDMLIPTIRAAGSQLWFSWNPDQPTDAVDLLFATLEEQRNKGEIPADRFVRVKATYRDNPLITQELLDEAARMLNADPDTFEHIWGGGYNLGGKGRVYSSFANREHPDGNLDESIEDTGGELLVGMDFNVNPMSAVVAVRAVDECLVIDALEIDTSNTEEMAAELKRRYPPTKNAYGVLVPRRIIVCPDPSGKARKTSAPVGQTDFTILERAGFTVRAPNAAPAVVDRINNSQKMYLRPRHAAPSRTHSSRARRRLSRRSRTSRTKRARVSRTKSPASTICAMPRIICSGRNSQSSTAGPVSASDPSMPSSISPVPVTRCPHCGFTLDTIAWNDRGHRPEPGDLTICQGCARVLRFDRHRRLTVMTDHDERAFLARNPDVKRQAQVVARQLLTHLTLRDIPQS
jgi:PBSX family phage terminase large subunit